MQLWNNDKSIRIFLKRIVKILRKKRGYVGLLLVTTFFLSCVFLRDWREWTKLGEIGKFFGGLGIILAAWQFAFQESNNRKEQIMLSFKLSEEITGIENDLNSLQGTITHKLNDIEHTSYLSKIKIAVLLFNRIHLLEKHKLIDFDELYILNGNSLVMVLAASIKACVNSYRTPVTLKSELTENFILKYKNALIYIYKRLDSIDESVQIFSDELEALERLEIRDRGLSAFDLNK